MSVIFPGEIISSGSDANPDFSNIRSASGRESEKASLREGVDQIERVSPMQTECTTKLFEFEAVDRRAVVAGFDGGDITSNAGGLLLGLVDRGLGLVRRFAKCFRDRRDARYVEHQVETIVGQRIFGLVLGYGGPQRPRRVAQVDPVFKTRFGWGSWPRCCVRTARFLAGARARSTVLSAYSRSGIAREYKKIDCDYGIGGRYAAGRSLSRGAREGRRARSCSISTMSAIPLHGMQEGRFYHAYYDEYRYLPPMEVLRPGLAAGPAEVCERCRRRWRGRRSWARLAAQIRCNLAARAHNPAGRQWVLQR